MNKPYVKEYLNGELQNPIDKSYVPYGPNRKARRGKLEDKRVLDRVQIAWDKKTHQKKTIKHYSPTVVLTTKHN